MISTKRNIIRIVIIFISIYCVLLIPEKEAPIPDGPGRIPFIWNQDEKWFELEKQFSDLRTNLPTSLEMRIDSAFIRCGRFLMVLRRDTLKHDAQVFRDLESALFQLGPLIGACPSHVREYMYLISDVRAAVKEQSIRWGMNSITVRQTMYRMLFGSRAALEEAMLQAPQDSIPEMMMGTAEPSQSPGASFLGLKIHSGDILVSRGGAPTSALIARGNDFPGNFSHVAFVHVDDRAKKISIIESHIERGVTVSSPEEYLKDTKLRIMALRLRSDLVELQKNPLVPHLAAIRALERARGEHIPYDFEMDYRDESKIFCSEVVSAAYRKFGITLWMGLSTISSTGVKRWLGSFGVKNFETQEPSDLEYDPQLCVVAEWRDPRTLRNDHVDNAVIDAILEDAEKGRKLVYDWYMLPVARTMKLYSVILNSIGGIGPIPEGMSATAGLKNEKFSSLHRSMKEKVLNQVNEFYMKKKYFPPYWRLLEMARSAKSE